MGKRIRRRKSTKKKIRRGQKQAAITQQNIVDVKERLERMRIFTSRAINLSEQLTADSLSEDNHLFWALVKYVENVQESAKQINGINKNFFLELVELDENDWKDLRGMRDWLAHKFWDVDPDILWETVTRDLVNLLPLLTSIRIANQLVPEKGEIDFSVDSKLLMDIPERSEDYDFKPGRNLILMAFTRAGHIVVIRIGRKNGRMVVVAEQHIKPTSYSVPPTSHPPL